MLSDVIQKAPMQSAISTTRRGPVTAALLTVACLITAILPHFKRVTKTPFTDPAFEQALAECLWASLSREFNPAVTETTIESCFDRALQCAPQSELGRLYCVLAESASGQVAIRKEIHARADRFLESGTRNTEELLSSENLPEPGARIQARLEASLWKLPRTFPKSDNNHDEAFNRFFQGRSDFAQDCCLAAVAECPDYLPAWVKLALNSEGPLRTFALRNWLQRDPENALPSYFLAAEIATQDPELAIHWIEQGNSRRRCEIPDLETPRFHRLRFPDSKEMRELSLVGQPVSPVGLANCRELLNPPFLYWAHPADALKQMTRTLQEKALSDCCSMSKPACARLVHTVARMCLRLMGNEHGDISLYFAGVFSLIFVEDILECDLDPKVQQVGQQLSSLRKLISKYGFPDRLKQKGSKDDVTRLFLGGAIDQREFGSRVLSEALRDSRLIERIEHEFRGI